MNHPIYLDYSATTPIDERVVAEMIKYMGPSSTYGNPASRSHAYGWDAEAAVEQARKHVAELVGCEAKEIIFTSGATESDNLAVKGVAHFNRKKGQHIVTCKTEHKAVLDPLERLARRGFRITLLPVKQAPADDAGRIDPDQIDDAIKDDTTLVSVMLANNEMGAIHPLQQIGEICRARGVLLHCDATQAVGKIPVDVHTHI